MAKRPKEQPSALPFESDAEKHVTVAFDSNLLLANLEALTAIVRSMAPGTSLVLPPALQKLLASAEASKGAELLPVKRKSRPRRASAADRLIDAAVDIKQNPDARKPSFMARQLVQCTLPHSDPGDVPVWTRVNGDLTLAIHPYVDLKTHKPLYPYGSIPRLLLFWIVTEAKRTKSRRIHLGNSLDAFMREIGLNPRTGGGPRGDAKRLHEQMTRLFGAMVSFHGDRNHFVSWLNMPVTRRGILWWDPAMSTQDNLWESWVELGEDFFAAITAAPVPVDTRALRALKRSPLALDLYAWLAHTVWQANKARQPRIVPWEGLHEQMGAEYAEPRKFRENALMAIAKIRLVYEGLRVESTTKELIVHPGPTPIPPRRVRIST